MRGDLDSAAGRAWDNGYYDGVGDGRDGYDDLTTDPADGEHYNAGYLQGVADATAATAEDQIVGGGVSLMSDETERAAARRRHPTARGKS